MKSCFCHMLKINEQEQKHKMPRISVLSDGFFVAFEAVLTSTHKLMFYSNYHK